MSGYPAEYWTNYGGTGNSYLDPTNWEPIFQRIADTLIERYHPDTALDAGCATGYLVEALRRRGVEAFGVDSSEFAIDHTRPGAWEWCSRQSLVEPLNERYDLITCIEVLEHIPAEDAQTVIANLCEASDNIIFTSSPSDFVEPTHVNVQPQTYWTVAFEGQGFARDEAFDGDFIVEWAMRFCRS